MGTVFAVSNAFNSLLEDLDPIFQQTADFNNVFAEVFDVFTEMVNLGVELMTAFRPLIQELMPVFQGLSQILKDIAARVRAFANEIRGLREYLGFKTFDKNATADGKAFVSTQTETTQSYLSRLQNNAFGLGAAADPSSRTAANTDRMADVLQRILDYMAGRLVEELSKLIEKISPDRIAGRAVEAASAAAGDYLGNLRAAIGTLGGGL
jgi:signal transduction histidine kinase